MIVITRNHRFRSCLLLVFGLLLAGLAGASDVEQDSGQAAPVETATRDFSVLVGGLAGGSFRDRQGLVEELAASGDPRTLDVLAALLEGRLYGLAGAEGEAPRVLIAAASGDDPQLHDSLDGRALGTLSSLEVRRIPINNSLRGQLRDGIARLSLTDSRPAVRMDAAKRLIASGPTPDLVPLLEARLEAEDHAGVHEALGIVLAMIVLDEEAASRRIEAIGVLSGALYPEVRARLDQLAASDPDAGVRDAARAALDSIQNRIDLFRLAENLFFGLSLGSVLLLAAIGLAITFGVMGVINMAHGELIMIGAYTTWMVQQIMPNHIDASILVAIPAAFLVAGLVGIAIERGVIRHLYGRPLETLLATFGISLVLQQAVRSIFSPLNRAVSSPSWMSGSLEVNAVWSITYNRLYILVFSLLVFLALLAILKKTSLGLKVRAVAQNRAMARACGVRADWVDAMTFGLGAGVAGVAGVALSQLTNVGPNLGQAYIIDSFMVVVFGGVGNLWGTLVGAMGLGVLNKFLEPWSGAVLAKILVLVLLILFIQKRPRGLFPQKGRAAEG